MNSDDLFTTINNNNYKDLTYLLKLCLKEKKLIRLVVNIRNSMNGDSLNSFYELHLIVLFSQY
jgi:hypothetical protein